MPQDSRSIANLIWALVKLGLASGPDATALGTELAAVAAPYAVRHLASSSPQVR